MRKVIYQKTKSLQVKDNNNSSDGISPNFIYGCLAQCAYCYVHRYNYNTIYVNENWDDIFKSILEWRKGKPKTKIPNQQSETQYVIDIGCNVDLSLHQKHLHKQGGLEKIVKWFDDTEDLQLTFATKFSHMLKLDVRNLRRKPRVRISIMPKEYMNVLEPNTTKYENRLQDIKRLYNLGYEVHINYSPVIIDNNAGIYYKQLFEDIKNNWVENLHAEVIFLTNHVNSMSRANNFQRELIQTSREIKNKNGVMRYQLKHKKSFISRWTNLHNSILPNQKIRYIF